MISRRFCGGVHIVSQSVALKRRLEGVIANGSRGRVVLTRFGWQLLVSIPVRGVRGKEGLFQLRLGCGQLFPAIFFYVVPASSKKTNYCMA